MPIEINLIKVCNNIFQATIINCLQFILLRGIYIVSLPFCGAVCIIPNSCFAILLSSQVPFHRLLPLIFSGRHATSKVNSTNPTQGTMLRPSQRQGLAPSTRCPRPTASGMAPPTPPAAHRSESGQQVADAQQRQQAAGHSIGKPIALLQQADHHPRTDGIRRAEKKVARPHCADVCSAVP